ncbi:MAG: response regulator [Acidobacteriota bacterium]|nr:response regulator [Acidobacteriota bacterium]
MSSTIKILVVDDNPTILQLMCLTLEKCGEIVTATDGADALMKTIDTKPDLIISDYTMPVMDGRALFDKLRARKETQNIPFIFLASQKEIDERLRMVLEGVEDYFVKPFFARDLLQQARRITARLLQQRMEKQGGGAGIKGKLSEISLIDWMQTLEQGRKTCSLMLRAGGEVCTLYFSEGNVTHAVCGDLKGDPAVFKILAWVDGDWEVDFQKNSPEHTTTMSTQGLMMEGLRMMDEANRDAE